MNNKCADSSLDRPATDAQGLDVGGDQKPYDPGPISSEELVEETFELKQISVDTGDRQVEINLLQQHVHAQIVGDFSPAVEQKPPPPVGFSPQAVREQIFAATISGLDSFLSQQEEKPTPATLPDQVEEKKTAKPAASIAAAKKVGNATCLIHV